ncbi:hypothetical protein XELAEV_18015201mg [Xenopus laevis]|uniref:Uncharacterized protein n=1 Tax=Xenopus laevis TaxID=8355 RepID=A0A974HVQ9_XENLA|nr:hypothetical protein XELAEV_18015201mg [Xenopus laevis]
MISESNAIFSSNVNAEGVQLQSAATARQTLEVAEIVTACKMPSALPSNRTNDSPTSVTSPKLLTDAPGTQACLDSTQESLSVYGDLRKTLLQCMHARSALSMQCSPQTLNPGIFHSNQADSEKDQKSEREISIKHLHYFYRRDFKYMEARLVMPHLLLTKISANK